MKVGSGSRSIFQVNISMVEAMISYRNGEPHQACSKASYVQGSSEIHTRLGTK